MVTGRKLHAAIRNWSYGLGRRLVVFAGAIVALFVTSFVLVNMHVQRGIVETRLNDRAETVANLLSDVGPLYLYSYNTADLEILLENKAQEIGIEALYISDPDGLILADGALNDDQFFNFINDELLDRALSSRTSHMRWDADMLRMAIPMFLGDEFLGVARADISLADLNSKLTSLWRLNIWMGSAFFLLGIWLSMLIASRVTTPLNRLISATDAAAQGNFEQDASLNTNDELEALSKSFNKMLVALRESLHEINSLAYIDTLTGLPNRRFFSEYLETVCDRVRTIKGEAALMFIDLDRFKQINDTLGHDTGDELLVEIGVRIRRALLQQGLIVTDPSILRRTNHDFLKEDRALLARLGGDEFTVVLSCTDIHKRSDEIARELLAGLGEPIHIGAETLSIKASIGIAYVPEHGALPGVAMKNADIAMYQAKNAGRGTFRYYDAGMAEADIDRIRVEGELKRALSNNELEIHFQPQFWTKTGELYGAEALVRWQHPERGLLDPASFLPIAEAAGLMSEMGRVIIRESISAASGWSAANGHPIYLGMNMSMEELSNPENLACILEALKCNAFDPRNLEIEVTEGTAMQDDKAVERTFEQLHARGIRLAVDDFGIGYSNLARLRALNFDTLKVDSSLIQDLKADSQSALLVKSIQQMAQALGLRVIAEGVTNDKQMTTLQGIGCEVAQGFSLGRPMRADDFLFFLAERNEAAKVNVFRQKSPLSEGRFPAA